MTTWADFLSSVRTYLRDNSTNLKYSNELIYYYTIDAILDYSHWFPLPKRVAVARGEEGFALPSDVNSVRAVECPEGSYLSRRMVRPGHKYRTVTTPTHYWLDSQYVYLNSDSADEIYLSYDGTHSVPSFNFSNPQEAYTFTFSIPDRDMELIKLYVQAQCLGQTRTRQANLDRFKRTGRRDDNPMTPVTNSLMDEYYSKVAERTGGGAIYLRRAK